MSKMLVPLQVLTWATHDFFEVGIMVRDEDSPTGLQWIPIISENHAHPLYPVEDNLFFYDGQWLIAPVTPDEWEAALRPRRSNGRGLIHRVFN